MLTGLVLSIAVLATGSIFPNVEARSFVDSSTGIKVKCLAKKDFANCTIIDRTFGLSQFLILPPGLGGAPSTSECATSESSGSLPITRSQGTWLIFAGNCNGEFSAFVLKLEGKKFTLISSS